MKKLHINMDANQNPSDKKRSRETPGWVSVVVVSLLLPWPLMFSQQHWWAFIPATLGIFVALRLLHREYWRKVAGIDIPMPHLAGTILLFVIVMALTILLLPSIYETAGIRVEPLSFGHRLGLLFQS